MDGSEKPACAKCGQPLSLFTKPAAPVYCWGCSKAYADLQERKRDGIAKTRKKIEAEARKAERQRGQR